MKFWLLGCSAFVGLGCLSAPASAQRADENIVNSAEDAFGARVGSENIGLYSPTSARGFNPMQAGNVRMEGLYFDQQSFLGRAIAKSTIMRVGLSAQSYPFPAPTGIADTSLFIPDGKKSFSTSVEIRQPIGLNVWSADLKFPVTEELAMAVGTTAFVSPINGGVANRSWQVNSIVRWKPSENFEAIPFVFYQRGEDAEVAPSVFTGGAYLPPRTDRGVFYGQYWADRSTDDFNAGLVVRGNPFANWRLQGGIFRSDVTRPKNFVVFFRNVQPSGLGTLDILRYPEHQSASTSGEVRASGVYTQGSYRHTVHFAVRGRETRRLFGGGANASYGSAMIGVHADVAEPPGWAVGVRDNDVVRQFTPGVSYVGQWAGVGEFSLGLQKSFYHRDFGKLGAVPTTTKSQPWLYNGTVAYNITPRFALYAGYTRGIEEFGVAPDNTLNAGAPLPAQLTKQIDGGLRYTIMPGMILNTGVFEVSKPYFDRDTSNTYTVVGNVRHSGIEFSLTGSPFTGFRVVAGAVILKARVSGLPVDQGLIGRAAPGTAPRILRLNLQYGPPSWKGFSVESQIENEGSQYANRTNTLRVDSLTTFSAGVRYGFMIADTAANVRVQVNNIANKFSWRVDGNSGRYFESPPRQLNIRLAADF